MAKKRVAIQGIEASFHDVAAGKFFGNDMELVPCSSFRLSCEKVHQGKADYCVMAIENSLAGTILTNYNIIQDFRLRIVGEVYMQIELMLMGLNGVRMEDLEQIHSHPMAIRQCEDFLLQYPEIKVLALSDTAECARNVRDLRLHNVGVIAGEACATYYGLTVLRRNIESHKKNYTRFIVLSSRNGAVQSPDKSSISFQLDNAPGCLGRVIGVFDAFGITIAKIQSLPVFGRPNEYTYLVDLEWNNPEHYRNAMEKVLKETYNLSILGEYQKADFQNARS